MRFFLTFITTLLFAASSLAADTAFQQWLAQQWPAAQQLGVSRATFDAATRGLEPDLTLPDLAIPEKPEKQPQQREFVQTPSQYLREASFDRLAVRGRELATQYRDTLARIEKEFGVPGNVVLAIWARETDYGGDELSHRPLPTLATQAQSHKRQAYFVKEILHAPRQP